jgi:hypothetical protein
MPAIPLRVFITPFAIKGDSEPAGWTCDTASDALNVVNSIWSKAKIQFVIQECTLAKPLEMAKDARTHDQRLLDVLSLRRPAHKNVHIFLLNAIPNLTAGGASYLNSDPEAASFVQSYGTAAASGRAWAHELGHLLSLDHIEIDYSDQKQLKDRSNLMVKGLSVGTDLNTTQIGDANKSKLAQQFSAS